MPQFQWIRRFISRHVIVVLLAETGLLYAMLISSSFRFVDIVSPWHSPTHSIPSNLPGRLFVVHGVGTGTAFCKTAVLQFKRDERMIPVKSLGFCSNVEVVQRFVSLNGLSVVDAGCGGLTFTKQLAGLGANVLAVDPDPIQAQKIRDADPIANIRFAESSAAELPADDNSINGVFFAYSLHHVPREDHQAVLEEVVRVLRPDGFLYVIEPIDGAANEVMKLFHDEDVERAAAWRFLETIAMPRFQTAKAVSYHGEVQFQSWDDYANQYAGKSFNSLYSEADVRRPEVEEAFIRLGGPDHRFTSPKNVMFLNGLK